MFWALMLISVAVVLLALTLRKVNCGSPAPVAHLTKKKEMRLCRQNILCFFQMRPTPKPFPPAKNGISVLLQLSCCSNRSERMDTRWAENDYWD